MSNRVELKFRIANLDNEDGLFGESDGKIILFMLDNAGGDRIALGETEAIDNNSSPVFKTPVSVGWMKNQEQRLLARVVDVDGPGEQEGIGNAEFTLEEILTHPIDSPPPSFPIIGLNMERGRVYVTCNKRLSKTAVYKFDTKAKDILDTEWFSESDPYVVFERPTKDQLAETDKDQITSW